jgi:thiamine monophosphate kinase
MFRNPHSLVQMEVIGDDKQVQQWTVEWAAAGALARGGASRDSLKVGDEVTVVGNPGRSTTEYRIRLNSILRPADGWKWSGDFD